MTVDRVIVAERVLDRKVAIVTGGANGIGRATALLFAQAGARVAIFDLDETSGQQTVEEIRTNGGGAIFVRTDVSVAQDVESAVKRTVAEFSRLERDLQRRGVERPQMGRWANGRLHGSSVGSRAGNQFEERVPGLQVCDP